MSSPFQKMFSAKDPVKGMTLVAIGTGKSKKLTSVRIDVLYKN